ncbi:putative dUTPase [Dissoconium aciculare CBS 342.82]|uniref:dUTPase n=1 Tax=Dissoconium aciculare CBS 342.82 TaxID=1314786 RepID=A0A6J3MFI1_9PEZI|nr:putative dUTPase [Dissoconium aciculare CBS 342.82]KAF1826598.1 putative dUTPase [Dissoconium aciculare CBS 342.82]
MILSGAQIISRRLVRDIRQASQQQPCGVDLTLRWISRWHSAAIIDFDNSRRQGARTTRLSFDEANDSISLPRGPYLVDFNETVTIPRDCMALVHPRSSLWRSGVGIQAGVVDSGYEGAMRAMMEVDNEHGVTLYRNAKLAQIVFEQMDEEVEGYSGIYQGSRHSSAERLGAEG